MLTEAELTALALAADPDTRVPEDAAPWHPADSREPLLPSWYMPPPMAGGRTLRGWRRSVLILLVLAFVIIEAYGLCSTYGPRIG